MIIYRSPKAEITVRKDSVAEYGPQPSINLTGGGIDINVVENELSKQIDVSLSLVQSAVDHGSVSGLSDDDHTQYIRHTLSTAASDFLVGSGSNTYVKKTLAETGAILETDIDHANLQNLNSANYTHLTSANHTNLTNGNATTLHKHDHGGMDGLGNDNHIQYTLLVGRSGGQTLIGGTDSGNNLTLQSTSHATKGKILFGTSAYDEVNNRLGIGTTSPARRLDIDRGHFRYNKSACPSSVPTVAINATAGNLNGSYRYRVTYVTDMGETEASSASSAVAPVNQQVNLTNIPKSSDSAVTARKLYRTVADGAWPYYCKYLATINDNTTTTYTDNIADGSLGGYASENNTTGGLFYQDTSIAIRIDSQSMTIGADALPSSVGFGNVAIGSSALNKNTLGYTCLAIGYRALYNNTVGGSNTGIGAGTLFSNTNGAGNTALGSNALYFLNGGSSNVAIGNSSMYNTTGYSNVAIGGNSLYGNTSGYQNIALGYNAGRYITDGSTANQTSNRSIYIGDTTKALASGDTNEIVIGYNTTGLGSNTVIIGNSNITKTQLQGNVGIGTASPTAYLHIKAGTASANTAPLKLTAGTLNTAPEAGAIEFDGTNLYFVDSGGTRKQLAVV